MKFLPPLFPLTNNGKEILLSGTDINLAGSHAKDISFLLSSFGIDSANDIGLTDDIGFESSVLGTIDLETLI